MTVLRNQYFPLSEQVNTVAVYDTMHFIYGNNASISSLSQVHIELCCKSASFNRGRRIDEVRNGLSSPFLIERQEQA